MMRGGGGGDRRAKINPDCGLTDEESLRGILNKNTIWPWNGKRGKQMKKLLHILTEKRQISVFVLFSVFLYFSYFHVCLFPSCCSLSPPVLSPFICLPFCLYSLFNHIHLISTSVCSSRVLPFFPSLSGSRSQVVSLSLVLFAVEWIVDSFSHDEYEANLMPPLSACVCVCVVRFWLDLCKSTKCMHPHTHTMSPASARVCVWVGGRATTPICHPPTPSLPLVASMWDNKNRSSKCLEWKIRSKLRRRVRRGAAGTEVYCCPLVAKTKSN